jgi:hypothetical protein
MSDRLSRLTLEGFRPIAKDEAGYSKTARRYINPDTGEILSRRKFAEQAKQQAGYVERARPAETKQRKIRADKGMTRSAYKLLQKHAQPVGTSKPVEQTVPYSYQPRSYLWEEITTGSPDVDTADKSNDWLASMYQSRLESEQGVHLSLDEVRSNPDFQVMIEAFTTNDYRAHGPIALVLEELGVREEGADYDVGDTPVSE